MKLRQIITEDQILNSLKQYFDNVNISDRSSEGISIDGDLTIKEGVKLKELPIKLNVVTGTLDLMNCGLTSLKNFPNKSNILNIGMNKDLKSLSTETPMDVNFIFADEIGVTDLSGVKLSRCQGISLEKCANLKSLNGLGNTHLSELNVAKCAAFEDDLTKYNIDVADVSLSISKNMPMVFLIALGKPQIRNLGSDNDPLIKIAKKYHNKGPDVVIDLIRELRDAGFKSAARIV